MVKYLLQSQADPNIPDKSGETSFHIASSSGHSKVVELLLQARLMLMLQMVMEQHRCISPATEAT